MNDNYPIILNLAKRRCLVVGGGRVAARKVEGLLAAGAAVTVVSPDIGKQLRKLVAANRLRHQKRGFRRADVKGVFLVIAAADNEEVNQEAAAAAKAAGVLVNVVDAPKLSTFTLPAVLRRGNLLLTVSTGGRAPAAAVYLRRQLAGIFGPEYEIWLRIVGEYRKLVLTKIKDKDKRAAAFQRLFTVDMFAEVNVFDENIRPEEIAAKLFKKFTS